MMVEVLDVWMHAQYLVILTKRRIICEETKKAKRYTKKM